MEFLKKFQIKIKKNSDVKGNDLNNIAKIAHFGGFHYSYSLVA